MNLRKITRVFLAVALLGRASSGAFAQVTSDVPAKRADSVVDLGTREGVRLLSGEWRYSEAQIVDSNHNYAGLDLKPSGPSSKTHDITPKAGGAGFNDSGWTVVEPTELSSRRGPGKIVLCVVPLQIHGPRKARQL
jgi:hypothetical protein